MEGGRVRDDAGGLEQDAGLLEQIETGSHRVDMIDAFCESGHEGIAKVGGSSPVGWTL